MTEAVVQKKTRVALANEGFIMFRNNVGQYVNEYGTPVKYGVCNPGGSDLLGWKPVVITQDMVGKKFARLTVCECKADGGKLTPPQEHFLMAVKNAGGIAMIARGETIEEI